MNIATCPVVTGLLCQHCILLNNGKNHDFYYSCLTLQLHIFDQYCVNLLGNSPILFHLVILYCAFLFCFTAFEFEGQRVDIEQLEQRAEGLE